MKRILVPTDFSECAHNASEVAIDLAKRSGGEIVFLHLAINPDGPSHVKGEVISGSRAEIGQERAAMDNLVSHAIREGIGAHEAFVIGNGQERIEDYIKPYNIDWLVMGSHGATGIRELVIGSRTQHVIRNVDIPTLVIKNPPINTAPKHIVFASTFRKDVAAALTPVVSYAKMWNASLDLLFINMMSHLIDEEVARGLMQVQMAPHYGLDYTVNIVETNDKEAGIAEFASRIKADVIAVALESKSLVGRLFNPNLAEKLVNHSLLPVLVVR